MSFTREREVVAEALGRACEAILAVYSVPFEVEWKGLNDPVTAADRRANDILVSALRQAFPGDAICAEEADSAEAARASARGGRCWFVDPMDGTREFVDRNGEFCAMVGLAIDGRAVFGGVKTPVTGDLVMGDPEGAFRVTAKGERHDLRVAVPVAHAPLRAVVSRSHANPRVIEVLGAAGVAERIPCGSVGLKVERVITGAAEVYVHLGKGPKLWDGCAPEAIARAAGLAFTNARGEAIDYATAALDLADGMVVAHPHVASRLLQALAAG